MTYYILSAVIVIFLLYETFNLISSIIAMSWKKVSGKIENWDMYFNTHSEGTDLIVNRLEYSYLVSGKRYDSTRVGFGFPWITPSMFVSGTIEKVLERAPELTVYYSPKLPRNSTLVVGIKSFHVIKIFIYGVILTVFLKEANVL